MAYYRLYFFNPGTGHIDHFREYEAPGDMAAVVRADDWRGPITSVGAAMELWSGGRKVKRWDAFAFAPARATEHKREAAKQQRACVVEMARAGQPARAARQD